MLRVTDKWIAHLRKLAIEAGGDYPSMTGHEVGEILDALEAAYEWCDHWENLTKSASADLHTTVYAAEKLKERVAELEALALDEHSRLSQEVENQPPADDEIDELVEDCIELVSESLRGDSARALATMVRRERARVEKIREKLDFMRARKDKQVREWKNMRAELGRAEAIIRKVAEYRDGLPADDKTEFRYAYTVRAPLTELLGDGA